MPKKGTTAQSREQALARLPRHPDLVIEGGKREMGIYTRDGDVLVRPHIALWVDAASGFVLATTLINPEQSPDMGVSEALEALLSAIAPSAQPNRPSATGAGRLGQPTVFPGLLGPGPAGGLPERVRVADADLAAAVGAVLGPLGVAVEHTAELPAFEAVYQSFAERMGGEDAEPPEPFAWDIDPAVAAPLYKAAARYARRAPWELLLDHPPLAVELGAAGPEPGVETLYASILGAGEEVFGVACYYSDEGYRRTASRGDTVGPSEEDIDMTLALLERTGLPIDTISPGEMRDIVADVTGTGLDEQQLREAMEDCLVLFLEDEEDIDPTYLDWLDARGVTFASRQDVPSINRTMRGGENRLPNAREARAFTLALEGLNGFISKHRALLETADAAPGTLTHTTRVGEGRDRTPVTVTAPAPGFEWADEYGEDDEDAGGAPLEPPSPDAATTLYRFQVKLDWRKRVWRRIELRGDQTLHDLHRAIQAAFNWDDDHLYAFFLSGRAWDESSEYASPLGEGGRPAARYPLERLSLREGQQVLYIFDFGDELRHLVTLEAIKPGGVAPGVAYPRIVESHGEAQSQYT